jgi:uncharacterized lipoprotein
MVWRLGLVIGAMVLLSLAGCSGESEDQKGVIVKQPSADQQMKDRGMSSEEIDSRAKAPH